MVGFDDPVIIIEILKKMASQGSGSFEEEELLEYPIEDKVHADL